MKEYEGNIWIIPEIKRRLLNVDRSWAEFKNKELEFS